MWIWEIESGKLYNIYGEMLAEGYAGHGIGKNNPEMQKIRDVGPLPQGFYTISGPADSDKLGPYVLPLFPASINNMFGRMGFFIHGDSLTNPGNASDGCIVLPREAREAIWNSGDHYLEVVSAMITQEPFLESE